MRPAALLSTRRRRRSPPAPPTLLPPPRPRFENCWLLGRIADKAAALLEGGRGYATPAPLLGPRPYRATLKDCERFDALCDALGVRAAARVSLGDLENRSPQAWRLGVCLWDVADALRARGHAAAVPAFAPAAERARLGAGVASNAARAARFASAGGSPAKRPAAGGAVYGAPRGGGGGAPAPAAPRLRTPGGADAAAEAESSFEGGASSGASGAASRAASPPREPSPPAGDGADAVLVALLSPDRLKPKHSQLLNAIMRVGGGGASADASPAKSAESGAGGDSKGSRRALALDAVAEAEDDAASAPPAVAKPTRPRSARPAQQRGAGLAESLAVGVVAVAVAAAAFVLGAKMGGRRRAADDEAGW